MNRVILKISGESLKDDNEFVSKNKLENILKLIKLLQKENTKIGIVIGGGNIFRGRCHTDMDKVTADTIGMLGTIMNALYIKDYLLKNDIKAVVSTPFNFNELLNIYNENELKNMYDNNFVIIFGGGLGKSGYSTDSGVIKGRDILDANTIIKLTNVDGVFDSDPKINKNAKMYSKLTYDDVINKNLKVMDLYAIKKCKEKNTKLIVMNFNKYNKVLDIFKNNIDGTIIEE